MIRFLNASNTDFLSALPEGRVWAKGQDVIFTTPIKSSLGDNERFT